MKRRFHLFGKAREAILTLLYSSPNSSFYAREISRRTGLAISSVQLELENLLAASLIAQTFMGRQTFYSANQRSPIFRELQSILTKSSGVAPAILECLAPIADHLTVAFLFGSFAGGMQTSSSDVDVMLIGQQVGFAETANLVRPAEEELQREINVLVYDPADFRNQLQTSGFLKEVMAAPKIFLIGDEGELGKVAGERLATEIRDQQSGSTRLVKSSRP